MLFIISPKWLFIVSIVSWAKSYTKNKHKKEFKQGTVKGLLGMGSFILTASLFASPLLGIIIGLVVLVLVKKSLKKNHPKVLYGGSVNNKNIRLFRSIPDIDGFLIGGASQSSKKFIDIIKNYYK